MVSLLIDCKTQSFLPVLPSPALVLLDGDEGAKANFTFGDLDTCILALLVFTAGAIVL
jgi:hypothetical protein